MLGLPTARAGSAETQRVIEASLFTVALTPAMFSSWLPSIFTLKSFALDGSQAQVAQKLSNLRSGYRPAAWFTTAAGLALSVFAHSPIPALVGAGMSIVMARQYEQGIPPQLRLSLRQIIQAELTGDLPSPPALQPGNVIDGSYIILDGSGWNGHG